MFINTFCSTIRNSRANITCCRPNSSSIYYPAKTKVTSSTRENVYIYAAHKLWLAYGLAIGFTALIAIFGMAAIVANHAPFSNKFSTILRLSRGAQISSEIKQTDLSAQDPLPAYAGEATDHDYEAESTSIVCTIDHDRTIDEHKPTFNNSEYILDQGLPVLINRCRGRMPQSVTPALHIGRKIPGFPQNASEWP